MKRLTLLAAAAAVLVAGCSDRSDRVRGQAAAAPGGTVSSAGSVQPAPSTVDSPTGLPTATVTVSPRPPSAGPPSAAPTAPPRTSGLPPNCPGCAGRTVADVRPGISVALASTPAPAGSITPHAWLVTFRTGTGQELARRALQGDYFITDAGSSRPYCDRVAHCFVEAGRGAHSAVVNALAVGTGGALSEPAGSERLGADSATTAVYDLDGDGRYEAAVTESVGGPYATAPQRYDVYRWVGDRVELAGCSPAMTTLPGVKHVTLARCTVPQPAGD
jgi:hypothetical protein